MNLLELRESLDYEQLGQDMHAFITQLYPICRSITGEGIRGHLAPHPAIGAADDS